HGPWAYVFSLSPKDLLFKGGETLLLKPEVLSYWKNFGSSQDRERSSFLETISPNFNRLIVFDPRIPHGVTRVSGVSDPREARLVIHGWFTEPKTYLDGYLPEEAAESALNQAFDLIQELCAQAEPFAGTLSLQVKVTTAGTVSSVVPATNTLKTLNGEEPRVFLKSLLKIYSKLKFPKSRGATQMTIPLIFQ
ncbi:MAG: 2OG-Fe(II) oxygenase, partial [Proteobacteria bacterium]|nr:2OG-Fe(II) oxygenase [Pseudomonadota bacterium]